ncbi:hypothetical protein K443DRAFT_671304 [Laccaria amethystina LaAM-08-1]|uniref:Velvet domain-containing protein n=1 Tax=Laccaria amethystina LaAM-08-1 TaxID=1095629 RepID=A0A0C9YN45_9AGAR|nr:hypothetical protein K443DRAFT_671304 [Laccaria amethystina LaAM-08-1]
MHITCSQFHQCSLHYNPQFSIYELVVRQEPKQARMCGVGGKADRRPIDPPPIVQLRVIDPSAPSQAANATPSQRRRNSSAATPPGSPSPSASSRHLPEAHESDAGYGQSFLQNPYYFMFASLAKPDDDAELHWLKDGRTRCTTGSVVSSLYHLKDPQHNNEDAGFFVFPDLSVRTEGSYRLKLSLFEVVGNNVRHCKSIYSAPFYVYTAKKFPGMEESTPLSCSLADQGIKIRIRKDIRVRKRPVHALEHPLPMSLDDSCNENGDDHHRHHSIRRNSKRSRTDDGLDISEGSNTGSAPNVAPAPQQQGSWPPVAPLDPSLGATIPPPPGATVIPPPPPLGQEQTQGGVAMGVNITPGVVLGGPSVYDGRGGGGYHPCDQGLPPSASSNLHAPVNPPHTQYRDPNQTQPAPQQQPYPAQQPQQQQQHPPQHVPPPPPHIPPPPHGHIPHHTTTHPPPPLHQSYAPYPQTWGAPPPPQPQPVYDYYHHQQHAPPVPQHHPHPHYATYPPQPSHVQPPPRYDYLGQIYAQQLPPHPQAQYGYYEQPHHHHQQIPPQLQQVSPPQQPPHAQQPQYISATVATAPAPTTGTATASPSVIPPPPQHQLPNTPSYDYSSPYRPTESPQPGRAYHPPPHHIQAPPPQTPYSPYHFPQQHHHHQPLPLPHHMAQRYGHPPPPPYSYGGYGNQAPEWGAPAQNGFPPGWGDGYTQPQPQLMHQQQQAALPSSSSVLVGAVSSSGDRIQLAPLRAGAGSGSSGSGNGESPVPIIPLSLPPSASPSSGSSNGNQQHQTNGYPMMGSSQSGYASSRERERDHDRDVGKDKEGERKKTNPLSIGSIISDDAR